MGTRESSSIPNRLPAFGSKRVTSVRSLRFADLLAGLGEDGHGVVLVGAVDVGAGGNLHS